MGKYGVGARVFGSGGCHILVLEGILVKSVLHYLVFTMPEVVMKNGDVKEVSDEEMLSFLQQNRDSIQNRFSPRRRPIKESEISKSTFTSTQ